MLRARHSLFRVLKRLNSNKSTSPDYFLHYQASSTSQNYEDAGINFLQDASYKKLVLQQIISTLELDKRRDNEQIRLIDLGGGTGLTSELLLKSISKLGGRVVCVDPFDAMLAVAKQRVGVETLLTDAVRFSSMPNQSYSHVLLKEMIHLVPRDELEAMFVGLHKQLMQGGKALIVTRPVEVFLPFPERVKEIWRTTQPHHDIIQAAIKRATGIEPIVSFFDCRVSVTKKMWIEFLRSRTWSEFSMLTDSEMEEGITEVTRKYFDGKTGDEESISFVDRLIFIVAEKSS